MERLRIDAKDAEIVRILQSDGRASWKEIAEKIHLSIPAVRSRVKRLEELGVIKGYIGCGGLVENLLTVSVASILNLIYSSCITF